MKLPAIYLLVSVSPSIACGGFLPESANPRIVETRAYGLEEPEPTCPECQMECTVALPSTSLEKFDVNIKDAHAYSGHDITSVAISFERDVQSWEASLDEYLDPATMYGVVELESVPLPSGFQRSPQSSLEAWLVLSSSVGDIHIQCALEFPD